MTKPYLSVDTFVNRISLEDQFRIAKEAGFAGIDYVLTLPDLFRKNKKVHELCTRFDMPIKGIHIPLFLIPYCPEILYERLYNAILAFPECEIFNVHLSSFVTHLDPQGKSIKKFFSTFGGQKPIITFESNPNTKLGKLFPSTTAKPEKFSMFCKNNNLPINLDISHIGTFDYDILKFYQENKNSIKLMHMSDFDGKTQHLPLGKGKLSLLKLFHTMRDTNYKGYVIFEIFQFPKEYSLTERLQELKQSVDMFKNETR